MVMLEVRLLGKFEVKHKKKSVSIPSRPSQSLFAYLILSVGTYHRREKLAGMLWPDSLEETGRDNLRHALWRIRKALPSTPKGEYLLTDDLSIAFNPSAAYWLDAAQLEKVSESASADELIEVLSTYQGELLPGFYDEWVVLRREHLYSIFEHHMARLMSLLQNEKRWLDIFDWGERWIKLGQKPEPAYRALMAAHAAKGDMSKVAATYERCVKSLKEFGIVPSEQTRALYEKLKMGKEMLETGLVPLKEKDRESLKAYLPVPLTSFIGREKEVEEIIRLVKKNRLVTLTGPGGVGKTRLAIQASDKLLSERKDDVWWVDLAPLTVDTLVPQAVAHVLGVRESLNQPLNESVKNFLRERQLLLVLDNCEHVITACAQLVDELLAHCAHLRILGTSREALGITGEMVHQVPTLTLPQVPRLTLTDLLMEYEGIRLFVERASTVDSSFVLTDQNAAAVLQICQRLDGIPLALELAAARTKLLTVEHIAERLNDRFNLLTQGSRTALPRQQTLRATIDWSYDLLPEEARLLFRRLSVFVGGFTLEAAEAVCSQEPLSLPAVLDLFGRLVDRSLVKVERRGEYERYRMLEIIGEYAREKLERSGETQRLHQLHRDFFIVFVEQAEPKLKGAEQFEWLDRLEIEHDNLRAAWDSAMQNDTELALRLASALLDFWSMRGNPGEGRQWLTQLLPQTSSWGQTARRAHVLGVAGQLAYAQRDLAAAHMLLEEAVSIARISGDKKEIALALLWLGRTAHRQHDEQTAQAFTEECLTIYQELQDRWGIAMAIYILAGVAAAQGHHPEAEERYMQSLATFQELGDKFRMGFTFNGLGELARLLGDYERARRFYEEDIAILRQQRSPAALVTPLVNQAWVSLHGSDTPKAKAAFEESLKLSKEYGNRNGMTLSLAGFAGILGMSGKPEQAARLFGAVESLLEAMGMARRMDPSDQKEFDYCVAVVRSQLATPAFEKAWAEGRTMTSEHAIAFALKETQN
jgi:predicted ATPase/DNA-binding SARP family transcriptional activator